jgi:hypothetical protein
MGRLAVVEGIELCRNVFPSIATTSMDASSWPTLLAPNPAAWRRKTAEIETPRFDLK